MSISDFRDVTSPRYVNAGPLRVWVRGGSARPTRGAGWLIHRIARESWWAETGIRFAAARTGVWSYLLGGNLRLEIPGEEPRVALPGQIVAVPAGQVYRFAVEPGAPLEHFILNATGRRGTLWWRAMGGEHATILRVRRRGELEHCLEHALIHAQASDLLDRAIACHFLQAALDLVAADQRLGPETAGAASSLGDRCRKYIQEHFRETTDARTLAAALGCHADYLARVYRARFGTTPSDHLRRMRMEQAAEWLRAGNRRLSEIAEALGYSDSFALSKAFKAYSGLSPRHWSEKFGAQQRALEP